MYAIRARRFTVRTLSYDPLHTLSYITSVFVARANQIIHRPRRVLFPARPRRGRRRSATTFRTRAASRSDFAR